MPKTARQSDATEALAENNPAPNQAALPTQTLYDQYNARVIQDYNSQFHAITQEIAPSLIEQFCNRIDQKLELKQDATPEEETSIKDYIGQCERLAPRLKGLINRLSSFRSRLLNYEVQRAAISPTDEPNTPDGEAHISHTIALTEHVQNWLQAVSELFRNLLYLQQDIENAREAHPADADLVLSSIVGQYESRGLSYNVDDIVLSSVDIKRVCGEHPNIEALRAYAETFVEEQLNSNNRLEAR